MAQDLRLSMIFGGDYDRIRPLRDGLIKPDGVDLKINLIDGPSKAFGMIMASNEYDGGEMSLSFYTTLLTKYGKDMELIGFPVYPSRMFRHGNIAYNRNSGIKSIKDLEGRVMALPEYGMTMAVWLRGLLKHEYGVDTNKIKWRAGRDPVALNPEALRYPAGVDIQRGADSATLVPLLNEGKIDAYIGPLPRELPPNVVRFFPDYAKAEQDYYRKTSIFPIMHVLVVRRKIVEANPWLAKSLYQAFLKSKEMAVERLWNSAALAVSLPWQVPSVDEQTKIMGGDIWPYGVKNNLPTLNAYLDYVIEQDLAWARLKPEELFVDVGE